MLDEIKCIVLLAIHNEYQPILTHIEEITTSFATIHFTTGDVEKALIFLVKKNFISEEKAGFFKLTAKGKEAVRKIKKARNFV